MTTQEQLSVNEIRQMALPPKIIEEMYGQRYLSESFDLMPGEKEALQEFAARDSNLTEGEKEMVLTVAQTFSKSASELTAKLLGFFRV
jgi:hypothetical protein